MGSSPTIGSALPYQDGSNNPEGIASTSDRIRFHPYYTSKDLVGFMLDGGVILMEEYYSS